MSIFMRATVSAMTLARKLSTITGQKNPIDSATKRDRPAEIPVDIYEKNGAYFRTIDGATVIRLDPESANSKNELIYLHGGSYVLPMTHMHWGIVDRLMKTTRSKATIPQYLLAPEHGVANLYTLLDKVYDTASERAAQHGGKVVMAGDSAGGGMALAYTMNRRERGLAVPDQLILFSPWLDATLDNPEIASVHDPMLNRDDLVRSAKLWAGHWGTRDPRVSPIFGSLEGIPPTRIYQGTQDILYPDVRAFARRAAGMGAPVQLTVAPTGFHVYVALPHLPESRRVYREIAELFSNG